MGVKSMFEKLNNRRLAEVLLFIGAFISVAWAIYFSVATTTMPYQIELREGVALVTTRILLNGENPFSFEYQPLAMTVYGIGYNLVVLPFAWLFGNTLLVHRAVTFVFILLSALICAALVYKKHGNISSALACGAFVIIGLIANAGIGAYPSSMGTYLFLAAVLVPYVRSFDKTGLFASIVLSLLAFYTKPYFVLAFGIVGAYLFLFVSKKKAIIYGVSFLVPFLLSLFAVRAIFPLYFIDTIVGNMSNTYRSFDYLKLQPRVLFSYFYPTLALALFMIVVGVFGKKTRSYVKGGLRNAFDISSWDQPFINLSPDYLFYSFVCSLLAFLLILGPHIGNYLNYAYQLLVPLFFCWFFRNADLGRKFSIIIVLFVLFNLYIWESSSLDPAMLEQKNSKEWAKLHGYVAASSNVLNAPLITSEMVELGLIPVDAGQTLVYYNVKPYPDFYLIGPPYSDWKLDGFRYTKNIDRSIEKQKFDLIVITEEKGTFFHVKLLPQYYSVVDEFKVDMPQTRQTWTVLVWKPLVAWL